MTHTEMKAALQQELKNEGFRGRVKKVFDIGVNTAIEFDIPIHRILFKYFDKKFNYGGVKQVDEYTLIINTPNEGKKMEEEKEKPATFREAMTALTAKIIDQWEAENQKLLSQLCDERELLSAKISLIKAQKDEIFLLKKQIEDLKNTNQSLREIIAAF